MCIPAYYIEAFCCSKAKAYLSHILSEEEFLDFVRRVQTSDPTKTFSIQNYHYETRTRTVTDGNGHSRSVQISYHEYSVPPKVLTGSFSAVSKPTFARK